MPEDRLPLRLERMIQEMRIYRGEGWNTVPQQIQAWADELADVLAAVQAHPPVETDESRADAQEGMAERLAGSTPADSHSLAARLEQLLAPKSVELYVHGDRGPWVKLEVVLAAVQAQPPDWITALAAKWRKGDPDFLGAISSTRQDALNRCADELEKAAARLPVGTAPQRVKGCINCGEAKDGGYQTDEVGSFCSQCWQALEQHFAAPQWQPIETAPKDGTWFLAWSEKHRHVSACHWNEHDKSFRWFENEIEIRLVGSFSAWPPTDWMPLPAPPGDRSPRRAQPEDR